MGPLSKTWKIRPPQETPKTSSTTLKKSTSSTTTFTKPGPRSRKMLGQQDQNQQNATPKDSLVLKTLKNDSSLLPSSPTSTSSTATTSTISSSAPSTLTSSSSVKYKPGPKSRKMAQQKQSSSSTSVEEDKSVIGSTSSSSSVVYRPGPKSKKKIQHPPPPPLETPQQQNSSFTGGGGRRSGDSGFISTSFEDSTMETQNYDDLFTKIIPNTTNKPRTASEQSDSESDGEDPPEGQYEIEDVLDYVNEGSGLGEMYLIKWKNWESDFNTWEPPANLIDCDKVLLRFYYKRKAEVEEQLKAQTYIELPGGKRRRKGPEVWKIPPDPRPLQIRLDEFYAATNKPLCETKLKEKYLAWNQKVLANKGKDTRKRWDESKLNKYLVDGTEGKLSETQLKELRKELYWVEVVRKKDGLDTVLKEWETSINQVTKYKPVITVENNVDLEGPPTNFEFVSDYIPANDVTIPSDPPAGCACGEGESSCYENRKKCCGHLSNAQFAYSRFRKVNIDLGRPIWECNSKCKCGPDCVNRVVQDGSNSEVKLCIFRTSNGCGWGVKALKAIKSGSFVCLYVGEVIKAEEAERRSTENKAIQPYLFDLDFNDHENPLYTVDAFRCGNASHFINHSCDPNLGVWAVWVDCLDPNLPKLAMFALRNIAKGEQLSFDYLNRVPTDSSDDEDDRKEDPDFDGSFGSPNNASPSKMNRNAALRKQKCLCGARNCRQFLYV